MEPIPSTKVFYNSACPVCDAGIAHQKEKMRACNVEWIDIHTNPSAASKLDTDVEFLRERLHIQDASGKVLVGAAAFASLWEQTPGQTLWAKVICWPVIRHAAELAYNLFAAALYRWNRWRRHW